MIADKDIARIAAAHALTESAAAAAVRKVVGRTGAHGHPTQERVAERFRVFARDAANLAVLDDRMEIPDLGKPNWRQRLADENAERLARMFASGAFVERYVVALLDDQSADVSSSHTGVREAFAHVFSVVTQVARLASLEIDPMMLPQPPVTVPPDIGTRDN